MSLNKFSIMFLIWPTLSVTISFMLFFSPYVLAKVTEMYAFNSSQKRIQFKEITHEMRCLVCQNQNLADSNAPLAVDLRLVIYQRIKNGETADQVRDYLISRYGNFISFNPRFSRLTFCLWFSPFILLLVILCLLLIKFRRFDAQISRN